MKTLTEFSTLTLRKAAEARASVPAATGSGPAPAPEATADTAAAAPTEGEVAVPTEGEPAAPAETGEAPAATDPAVEAIAQALGVQPDRAARLVEALDIIGNQLDQVRLVRVYQGESGPQGSVSRGEFHYVIDRVAGQAKRAGREDRALDGDQRRRE